MISDTLKRPLSAVGLFVFVCVVLTAADYMDNSISNNYNFNHYSNKNGLGLMHEVRANSNPIDLERYQDLLNLAKKDETKSLIVTFDVIDTDNNNNNNNNNNNTVEKVTKFESVLNLKPFTLEPTTKTTAEKKSIASPVQ